MVSKLLRLFQTLFLGIILGALTACLISVDEPQEGATITLASPTDPTKVVITGNATFSGLKVSVDGIDFSSQMAYPPGNNKRQEGNLPLGPGAHTLVATADVYCWYCTGQTSQSTQTRHFSIAVTTPTLTLGPPGLSVNVGATKSADVRANPAPSAPLTVSLSDPSGRLTVPATVSIPAGSTNPVGFTVQGLSAGTASLTAAAPGFASSPLQVTVVTPPPAPVVSGLCPSHGPPGVGVRITGTGFIAPVSVKFGNAAPLSVTPTSTTEINTTIPMGIAAGTPSVTVTSGGQTSAGVPFTVTAGPLLFRATNDRVERIRFTPGAGGGFQLIGSTPATVSPGNLSVGLARTCDQVARASASDAQLFQIGGTAVAPTLTLLRGTPLPTGLSGNGTSIGFLPGLLIRGTDMGIETINPTLTPMAKLGGFNGASSSTGVSLVTLPGSPPLVFRSHASGIDVYDVGTPSTPSQVANLIQGMSASGNGTALAWVTPGSRLVRASSGAIEVIDASGSTLTRRGGNITGGSSSTGVGVAVTGDRAVRGTNTGLEVYAISNPAAPQRCGFRNADLSTSGVAVVVLGTVAFRATDDAIEAYDISTAISSCPSPPATLPAPVQLQTVSPSTTGVALVGP